MLSFLRPPETKYESLEEVGRFNMLWNISLILVPIFFILATLHVVLGDNSWITSLSAGSVALINLIVLRKVKMYKIVGVWTVALSVIIVQASVFLVNDSHLISDTMWCLLSAFFSFFLFGMWIGAPVLLLNLAGLTIFLMNGSNHDIINKGISISEVDYKMVLNVFYVAMALIFVIYKMMENNKAINFRYEKKLEENKVLMKEIHHRVKNNLQIMSSLLRLQSADSRSEIVKVQFDEAISRIRSMALIHEKMYQKEDLNHIDVRSYLVSLTDEIANSIQSTASIEFSVESDLDEMNVQNIVPVSLIFNELITNSIKHGFANKKQGQIKVEINQQGAVVQFEYFDNGSWIEPKDEGTFGLELLSALTEQLDGEYSRSIENGTRYIFSFPVDKIIEQD